MLPKGETIDGLLSVTKFSSQWKVLCLSTRQSHFAWCALGCILMMWSCDGAIFGVAWVHIGDSVSILHSCCSRWLELGGVEDDGWLAPITNQTVWYDPSGLEFQ